MNFPFLRSSFLSAKHVVVFVLTLYSSFFIRYSFAQAPDSWTAKASLPFLSERERGVGIAINGKGYIGTGVNSVSGYLDGWWEYDPVADSWDQKAYLGNGPTGTYNRSRASGFTMGAYGYVTLGYDGNPKNGLFQYNPATDAWVLKQTFGGAARYSAMGFSVGGKGYIAGGFNGTTTYNDLWEYDPGNNTWTQKANIGLGRYSGMSFSIGNYGYVGTGYSGAAYLNDFWRYNPLTNSWAVMADVPGALRAVTTGFSIGNKGYVVGGSDAANTPYANLYEYNPITNQWVSRASIPGARWGASAFVIGNVAYVGTGYNNSTYFRDLYMYTPATSAPVMFQKTYGGTNMDTDSISYASPTNDGGYIVASSTKSFGNGAFDIYLIKTDEYGDTLWTRTHGSTSATSDDMAASIRQTADGGYIIAGRTGLPSTSDLLVIKTLPSGALQWNRTVTGTGGQERGNYAEEIAGGGGYVATGKFTGTGMNSAGLLKLNTNGTVNAVRTYGGTGSSNVSEGYSIEQIQGGSFIIGGHVKQGPNPYDAFLTVVASTGTTAITSIGLNSTGNGNEARATIRQTADGKFLICGIIGTPPNQDIFLVKTNTAGNILGSWPKRYGGAANDVPRSVIVTNTGEYAIAGITNSYGAGGNDAFMMLLDTAGVVRWSKTYGGSLNDGANSLHQAADGGFIISGETFSFSAGMSDVYLIKTDSLGNSGCNEAPVTIPLLSPPTFTTVIGTQNGPSNTNTVAITSKNTQTVPDELCVSCSFPLGIIKTNVTCFNACNGTASAIANGGTLPYTYSWTTAPVQTTQAVSALCPGTYTVTVTDANSCSATNTVTIVQPLPMNILLPDDTVDICQGFSDTIMAAGSGGTPGYTYFWTPSTNLSNPNISNPVANPTTTTSYTISVTDANGCNDKDTVVVKVHAPPNAAAGPDRTICAGTPTTLGGALITGVNYLWSPSTGLNNTTVANPVATPTNSTSYAVTVSNAFGCTSTDIVTVTTNASPTLSISATGSTTFCSGGSVLLSAATNGISYSWSPGGQTTSSITASPSATTVYTVTVSNNISCTSTATIAVTVNQRPFPVFSTTNVTCFGNCDGKSTATATGGTPPYTYSWSTVPVQTTQTATGLCDTVYTVFITDAKGCSASGKDTITQPPVFITSLSSSNAGCSCSGTASVTPTGGTPPYTYAWNSVSGNSTTQIISGLCTGSYTSTATDANGCVDTHVANISGSPPVVVSVSNSVTICSGTSTTIGAFVTGASFGINYTWTPGPLSGDTVSVSPAGPTNYTVIATDPVGGCADTGFVFVNVAPTPTASITGPATICVGSTGSLTGSGIGNYVWSPGGQTTSSITGIATTPGVFTYTLTVSNSSSNTCTDAATFTVTVLSSPVITTDSKYDTICSGLSSTTLTATGGTSYFWMPGGQTNDSIAVSPNSTTTYTVYVSNTNGCSGTATVPVVVQGGFNPPVVTGTLTYCYGDTLLPLSVTPTPPAIVVWFDSTSTVVQTGTVFQPPQNLQIGTTSYIVVQGTSDACVSDPVIVIITVNPLPNANVGNDISICSGHTANLVATGGTSYLWSPSTYLNNTTIPNPSATLDSTFSYQVVVTDANNCKGMDSITIYTIVNDTCGIHIYNAVTPNGDGDNDVWWIDGINLFPDNFVEIFNRWGNSVWSGKNYDNRKVVWRGQNMTGQSLPAGTYYYVIDVKELGRFSKWVELMR